MEAISAALLGLPYDSHTLIGSATKAEVFVAPLQALDCVTYMETVLALARSASEKEFMETLRKIRYSGGKVEWKRRNHYTTDWVAANLKAGFLRPVPGFKPTVRRSRLLNVVPGLAAQIGRAHV